MWADNETTVDLLGFDYLVDSLEVVLTEPRLLPVTVGVLGDWGSGKSSLLGMVAERLNRKDYVVVSFSPWRYEGYEDVKAALMNAVLTALAPRVPASDTEKTRKLRRLLAKVARLMRGPAAVAKELAGPVAGAVGAEHGLPPEVATAIGTASVAGLEAIGNPPDEAGPSEVLIIPDSVADFRDEFESLVDSLDDVLAVIVLIDDLDRCLDHTVVEIFEAIRLFLQVSSAAFVIAAHREIVQAAIERRYPAAREGDASLGKDYLEKIVQVEVAVPPLSEPEAETYLNLLFADLRLDEGQMKKVCDAAREHRRLGQFAVAMNYGIAQEVLGSISDELQADFMIANRIASTLCRGLRGNPRQLKRFLNTMLLRIETAKRRGVTLDPAILAKLMVLEQNDKEFQRLFLWQLAQDGAPEELAMAEKASTSGNLPKESSDELKAWFGVSAVRAWLGLEPPLTGVALGEYFFFSRDRLSPAAPGSRLSAQLQALLTKLQAEPLAQRRAAVGEAAAVSVEEFASLYAALLDRARRRPDGPAMHSATEIAGRRAEAWPTLAAVLKEIPPKDIPKALPLQLVTVGRDQPEVQGLLSHWENDSKLKGPVAQARKGIT
jgi:hypothetical protein